MTLRVVYLGIILVALLSVPSRPQSIDSRQGLLLYWNFEDGSGSVISDLAGGESAQIKGSAQWGEGRFAGGLQLNGVDDFIETPLTERLKLQEALTVGLWIKCVQKGHQLNTLLFTDRYRLVSGWGLDTRFEVFVEGQWRTSGHFSLPLSQWMHVVGTYSATARMLRLYINGELKKSQTLTDLSDYRISVATAPLRLVQTLKAEPENRIIVIDEVRIYNRALSPAEVQSFYQYVPLPSFKKRDVVISEVAWSGTPASPAHEWIELYSNTDKAIDLTGWKLVAARSGFTISLRGTIPSHGYYLLEAQSDNTVRDIKADLVYFASLKNSGDTLTLLDPAGNVIDTANGDGGPWPAGTDFQEPLRASMERLDPKAADADANGKSNDGRIRNGRDAAWNAINGTPKAPNSARR